MSMEKNIPGSRSPYTVWLSRPGGVVGMDYQELNHYIQLYNRGLYKYVEFFPWLSYEVFGDTDYITGFSALWNDHNPNMKYVEGIK